MATLAALSISSRSRSTQESLWILRRRQLMQTERKQLPEALTAKKKRKASSESTPIRIACRQLIVATTKIVKVHVEVACSALSRSIRKRGTRKTPPPSPKPLNIPAQIPYRMMVCLFSSTRSSFSKSSSPSVRVAAVQKSRLSLLQRQNQAAMAKMTTSSTQQSGEHLVIPTRLGTFSEPLRRERRKQAATRTASWRKILMLIASSKGLILLSLRIPLVRPCSSCSSSSCVSLACASRKRRQMLASECVVTRTMTRTTAALGSQRLRRTPMREPTNMSGSTTKAYWQRIMGSLLKAVRIWFAMLPKEDPMMLAKTTIVASFGSRPKQRIRITTFGPPPPSPARLERPAIRPISRHPTTRHSTSPPAAAATTTTTHSPRSSRTRVGTSQGKSITVNIIYAAGAAARGSSLKLLRDCSCDSPPLQQNNKE